MEIKAEWIICPVCGRKTHNKIRENTEMKNVPLYCPKYRKETLINVQDMKITLCPVLLSSGFAYGGTLPYQYQA